MIRLPSRDSLIFPVIDPEKVYALTLINFKAVLLDLHQNLGSDIADTYYKGLTLFEMYRHFRISSLK